MTTDSTEPYFTKARELLWARPERRNQKAKIAIIGGNLHGFQATQAAYLQMQEHGAGQVRVLLPEALRSKLPPHPDLHFAPATSQGSFAHQAVSAMADCSEWADLVYLPGELSNNSETALTVEEFVASCKTPLLGTDSAVAIATHSRHQQPDVLSLFLNLADVQHLTKHHKLSYTLTIDATAEVVRERIQQLAVDLQAIIIYSATTLTISDGHAVVSTPASDLQPTQIAVLQGEFPTQRWLATLAATTLDQQ